MVSGMQRRIDGTWKAAALVGLVSLALGLITIGRKSFWYDEAFDGVRIRGTWRSLAVLVGETEMSQAAYLVLLKAWSAVVPGTDVWLRLPSVAAACLASALLVVLGARLVDRLTGIVAGLLLATHELVVSWSQQARTYALLTLAVVVVSLLFLRAVEVGSRPSWLLYGLAAGLSVYVHFFAGLVVAAQLASLPLRSRRPPGRYVSEAVAVLVAVGSVAVAFTATAPRRQIDFLPEPTPASVWAAVAGAVGHNWLLPVAALAGLVVLARRARRGVDGATWLLALLACWLLIPLVLSFLVSLHQPILADRYLIVVAPGLALAAAVTVSALARRRRALGVVALAAVVAVAGVRIVQWYTLRPEDWRAATTHLEAVRTPVDDLIVAPAYAVHGLRFYDRSVAVTRPPVRRRTFVLLWGDGREERARRLRAAIGPSPVATVSPERPFGDGLGLVVVEPAADG